jgi:hypothetical protein
LHRLRGDESIVGSRNRRFVGIRVGWDIVVFVHSDMVVIWWDAFVLLLIRVSTVVSISVSSELLLSTGVSININSKLFLAFTSIVNDGGPLSCNLTSTRIKDSVSSLVLHTDKVPYLAAIGENLGTAAVVPWDDRVRWASPNTLLRQIVIGTVLGAP